MPLCRVGTPGCGCPKKQRMVNECLTIAIPDNKGNPIAYESCRDKCVKVQAVGGMPLGLIAYPGAPAYGPQYFTMYPGGPVYY